MNQGTLSSIFFFFFFSSLHSTVTFSSSINPKFQACQPATCGSLTGITYPFYIQNRQQSFCGYPGFGISCSDNGLPIVNLFGKNYTIDEISYPNQSIRVFDSGFSISTPNQTSCGIPRLHNLTLQGSRFQFGPNQKYLFLVFGCDLGSLPKRWSEYRVGCSVENGTDSVLAMTGEGRDLREAAEKCGGGMVRTKVEDGTEEKGRRIEEVLRRGFVLNWVVSDCSQCKMTGGKCGFDADPVVYSFKCYCRDRDHLRRCNPDGKSRTLKLGLGLGLGLAVGGGVCVISISLLIILQIKKKRFNYLGFLNHSRSIYFDILPSSSPECVIVNFGVPIFSYEELQKATNNFDPSRELGSGGFGTVYYGQLKDGREVAVKHLYQHKRDKRRVKQFMNEIQILTRLRHRNLVSLYGCTSPDSHGLLLIYEYISNGTVASHLHGARAKSALPWPIHMKIAIEIASALTYLHACDIIHRDVKTNNILLDDNFCVKVADFGISRLSSNDVSHVSTAPKGTMGYVDPEYHENYRLTKKSDVYSFGVVLIELISSMQAVDITRKDDEIKLANLAIKKIQRRAFAELVDPSLSFDSNNEFKRMISSVAELAFQCLQRDTDLRPSMYQVWEVLLKIESGKDEPEPLEVHGGEISKRDIHTPPPNPLD